MLVAYQLKSEAQNLAQKEAKLRLSQEEAANEEVAKANSELEQIMSRFLESTLKKGVFSMRDAQAAIATVVEGYASKPVATITAASDEVEGKTGDAEPLKVGDQVMIKRLGKMAATVVEIPQAENDYLTVQAGTMKMRVKLNEIVSRVTSGEKEGGRIPPEKKVRVSYPCLKSSDVFSCIKLLDRTPSVSIMPTLPSFISRYKKRSS